MSAERISLQKHIEKYMTALPEGLVTRHSPIQVYPLETVARHLKYPTPLLLPQYNFIIQITQGQISAQIGSEQLAIGSGSAILMMSNKPIARHAISQDLTGFCTVIADKVIDSLLTDPQLLRLMDMHPIVALSEGAGNAVSALTGLLLNELNQAGINDKLAASLLQSILFKLLEETDINVPFNRCEEIALRFKKLVYEHFHNNEALQFYAQQLNVSENYLYRCVKQTYDRPPKAIMNEIIINHSYLLLHDMSKEIAEVAYTLNFNDPSYFGRLFKKVSGQTPREYRALLMQDLSE